MKRKDISQGQDQKPAAASVAAAAEPSHDEMEFVPSSDEVTRKACFTYVNQDSLPGNAVQHWLAAESQLLAERKLTRARGFIAKPETHFPGQPRGKINL